MIDPLSRRLLQQATGPLALMYHSVESNSSKTKWTWSISLRRFQSHLDLIQSEGWKTIDLKSIQKPNKLPERSILITFDDGFADNMAAFEEIYKRRMQATWFIVSNTIGKYNRWDSTACRKPMLDVKQIRELNDSGMNIGAHSCSHQRLSTLPRIDQLEQEVSYCKKYLEDVIGKSVTSFAYPYGDLDQRVIDTVINAGYELAFSTRSGKLIQCNDFYMLRRIAIFNHDSASTLARKIAFADNEVGWPRIINYGLSRIKSRLMA